MTIIVELKSLSINFYKKKLIDNISFKINTGKITTLIGKNGVGKTTIVKTILGQKKYNSGSIILKKNIQIGYLPQKIDININIPIKVKNLLTILCPRGIDYNLLNLEEFIQYEKIQNYDISNISGGELQKLLLIGTLMNKPDLLILDEPTQFLDIISQQKFYQILKKVKQRLRMTIFMISHDLFTIMKNSDQVICLNGSVCCSGKPTDLYTNVKFKNALSEMGTYIHKHKYKF